MNGEEPEVAYVNVMIRHHKVGFFPSFDLFSLTYSLPQRTPDNLYVNEAELYLRPRGGIGLLRHLLA